MTWWEAILLAVASFLLLYALGAWNVAALRRRRERERQEAALRRQVWLDDPDTASPGEERRQ